MSRPRRSSRSRTPAGVVEPEMNVTPLVDVVLVLLIIFMVVAPRMNQDIPLNLPGVFHADPDDKGGIDPLQVSVPRPGEFYLADQQYDLDGIISALTAEHVASPLRRLSLRAEAGLAYGDVRPLLEKTQAIGFPGLSLLVGEKHLRPGEEAPATAPEEG